MFGGKNKLMETVEGSAIGQDWGYEEMWPSIEDFKHRVTTPSEATVMDTRHCIFAKTHRMSIPPMGSRIFQ